MCRLWEERREGGGEACEACEACERERKSGERCISGKLPQANSAAPLPPPAPVVLPKLGCPASATPGAAGSRSRPLMPGPSNIASLLQPLGGGAPRRSLRSGPINVDPLLQSMGRRGADGGG